MVVSEMGEQWSPKIPPPSAAAIVSIVTCYLRTARRRLSPDDLARLVRFVRDALEG